MDSKEAVIEIQPIKKALLVLGLALLSAGCVPTSQVPIYESAPSNGPHRTPVEEAKPVVPEPVAPKASQQNTQVAIRPGSADSDRTAKAVAGLLSDGWRLYDQERHDASISVAERALRIDRYDPQVYLLLARNYLAQWQLGLAEQLARQGLSVSSDAPSTRFELEQVLSQIEAQKR